MDLLCKAMADHNFGNIFSLLNRIYFAIGLVCASGVFSATVGPPSAQEGAPRDRISAPDSALIEKGRYLAVAGDCISCHTRPGGDPYSGGLGMATDFGTLYTPNITPNKETGIGDWTLEQFARALRQGIDSGGHHLYPVFPYPSYTKVSDEDVAAIYAFMKSLPSVRYAPPPNEMKFPFNIRELMFFWKLLYFKEDRFQPHPDKSAEWNRGAYLIEGLEHCGECHTPRNMLGGSDHSMALTGGIYSDFIADSVEGDQIVEEGFVRRWSPVDLTPSSTGLAAWTSEDIQNFLKLGDSERAGVHGPMKDVVENSTRHLTDEDIRAMALYLTSLPPKKPISAKAGPSELVRAGEIVYTARCGNCHLPTGLGIARTADADPGKVSPPLIGNPIVQAPDPSSLINQILYGSHAVSWGTRSWPKMPGFQDAIGFNDDQIAAVCTYVRSAWGNRASACSASDADQQR